MPATYVTCTPHLATACCRCCCLRSCAAALIAFLSHAGYRMAGVYGRQFHKLLGNLAQHYLPALEAKAEKDTSEFCRPLNLSSVGLTCVRLTCAG
jgi:hypothetical protein